MQTETFTLSAVDGLRLCVRLHRPRHPPEGTCLLLHGFCEGGYVWEDVCAALGDICTTAVPDLRGHGESGHSPTSLYHFDANVQDVTTLITQLGGGPIVVVGHSFGGEIALRIAARPPVDTRVAGAVFIDIAPDFNRQSSRQATTRLQEMRRIYRSAEEYCSLLMSVRPLLGESTARQLGRGALRECEGGVQLKFDPALMKYADEEFTSAAQWQQLLRMVLCPSLVVRGAASAMVSAKAAMEMVRSLPRAELVTIARAGHAVMSDNSAASAEAIASFVAATLQNRALP
jgi:pimeloyl-ACP methyl ester carboxylesterase